MIYHEILGTSQKRISANVHCTCRRKRLIYFSTWQYSIWTYAVAYNLDHSDISLWKTMKIVYSLPRPQASLFVGKRQIAPIQAQCTMGRIKPCRSASWAGSSRKPSHDPLQASLVLVSLVPKSARARLGTRQVYS